MAENSKIAWTDHTFNPWEGCNKVSPGCLHCYAENRNARWNKGVSVNWGKGAPRRRTSPANWLNPIRWNKRAEASVSDDAYYPPGHEFDHVAKSVPNRPRVFCASLADWLDDEVPVEWLVDLFKLIENTPHLDWLLLTKRPQNFFSRMSEAADNQFDYGDRNLCGHMHDWFKHGIAPRNVWVGVSIEDRPRKYRLDQLRAIPARVRFLSCEPLLSDLGYLDLKGIDWIIAGGESGPSCRSMEISWAQSLRDQCGREGVPFFMKQLGGHPNKRENLEDFPEDLRIREFPCLR